MKEVRKEGRKEGSKEGRKEARNIAIMGDYTVSNDPYTRRPVTGTTLRTRIEDSRPQRSY